MGPIIATFAHLQRELQVTSDSRHLVRDHEVNAEVQRREAERQEAQLKCDLEASREKILEAQETSRGYERQYHDTLVLLKKAHTTNPATANTEDQARF